MSISVTKNKKSFAPLALKPNVIHHRLLNHLVRLGLRMHEHGWLGSECFSVKMENDKRMRIEYSINPSIYHRRIILLAEKETVRIVNNSPTHFKPIGAIVDAQQWKIKEVQTNVLVLGDIPQHLKAQMRWEPFEYKKEISATRDWWLKKLRGGSPLFIADETSTPQWFTHMHSVLEFNHPLNSMVSNVVANVLPNADPIKVHNTKLRHYVENATATPSINDTIATLVPLMLDQQRTWPAIRLHTDREGAQHFVFSTPESVVPILHVKKGPEDKTYSLLDCTCKDLDNAKDIHAQILNEISKPSVPLENAWLEQLKGLSDFKLLETTTRPDQLWMRCVKTYAEQMHVEMVRSKDMYEPWSEHFIQYGDSNMVTTVLAAMKLARRHQPVVEAGMDTGPSLS